MRTAEEIIKIHLEGNLNIQSLTPFALGEIINVARKEAIIECAERVKHLNDNIYDGIDKQSILNLINELK